MMKRRRKKWAGHVARMKKRMNKYRILVEKPGRKRPLGRLGRSWEDDNKMVTIRE
jgi:hypothetical protein